MKCNSCGKEGGKYQECRECFLKRFHDKIKRRQGGKNGKDINRPN